MYNCDRGIGFGLGNSPNTGGIIRNNIIYNDGLGIYDDVGIGLESSPNTKVYNNTIHIQYPNAIEYRFAATAGVSITNNLTNQQIRLRNGGQATLTSNVTTGEAGWYRDLQNGDLRLASAIAQVVDQGIDLTQEVTYDIDKTVRYIDSGFDIGAFEYGEVTTNTEVVLSDDCISLYPNPNEGLVTISGDLQTYKIDVLDQLGQLHQQLNSTGTQISVDISSLPGGMYFLRVVHKENGKVNLQKMIKRN